MENLNNLKMHSMKNQEDLAYYFRIRLAGKNIEVECRNKSAFSGCKDYLVKFEEPDFVVKTSEERLYSEYSVISKEFGNKNNSETRIGINDIEPLVVYKEIIEKMVDFDVFLLHGSAIALDNQAVIFIAPSGTGKSTRTKLWLEEYPDSIVVNGDKPLIKVSEDSIIACGTPWCGKEGWNSNIMVPVNTLFLLERVNIGEKSTAHEISFKEAFPIILQQTYFPASIEGMYKTIRLLKALENKVRIYRFRSAPDSEAIKLAYEIAFQS